MSDKLVIVESPSKSKTIEQFLGSEFTVLSSKGHIRDLSISGVGGLGLDIDNEFKPKYDIIKEKKKVVTELKKAAKKADEVYLATDPDREGEAISWHLKETLGLGNKITHRVIFNEITRDRVKDAFEHPRDIDYNLVSSQETRRILDRIIGFKLSKLLQNKIKSKSAGRVQSATLKLIVDKEKEISAFVPEEYWKVVAAFSEFDADLVKYQGNKAELPNEATTMSLLDSLQEDFQVSSVKERSRQRDTKFPFTTSTLQQEASSKLNFTSSKTMLIAQRLYEGIQLDTETVGLITYMRTDSYRLSDSFSYPAIKFIEEEFGSEYKGFVRKAKKGPNIQDAHEAIRPTSLYHRPKQVKAFLSRDEYRLYQLIYTRTLASLMKPATLKVTDIELTNKEAIFKATAQAITFDGYLKVYTYDKVNVSTLPNLTEGSTMNAESITPTQHFTSPPARYNEAKLIKDMEELGIGRPSTYSQTISIIKKRKYVSLGKDKRFVPTEQGMLTIEKLEEFFSKIISVDYTARMERVLDDISEGEQQQTNIVGSFYRSFIPMVENANKNMEKVAPKFTGEDCPECGSPMVFRQSRYGTFEACSDYPTCKYIKTNKKEKKEVVTTGITCPKCGKGEIVERTAKRGRNAGKTFYACNNFPKCKNMLFGKPTGAVCPNCGSLLIENNNGEVVCSDQKECGYKE